MHAWHPLLQLLPKGLVAANAVPTAWRKSVRTEIDFIFRKFKEPFRKVGKENSRDQELQYQNDEKADITKYSSLRARYIPRTLVSLKGSSLPTSMTAQ
jgi:hypothetical protein